MVRRSSRIGAGFVTAIVATAAMAFASPAPADNLGLVLIHGKQGRPAQFQRTADAFNEAGWLTEQPEMCWSRTRIYDRPYLDCLTDIDAAVAKLRARGARKIVPVGMSLGGNAVLAYGARRDGLAGVVTLAAAHAPEFLSLRPDIAQSLQKARRMVAEGRGNETAEFADTNTGEGTWFVSLTLKTTTAATYVSFFAPESPAMMPANAAKLKAPLLMFSGTNDPTQRRARMIFGNAPNNPMNRFVSIEATHAGTPAGGRQAMVEWMQTLLRR